MQRGSRGQPIYWIGPPGSQQDAGEGTDFAAIEQGYVSITPDHRYDCLQQSGGAGGRLTCRDEGVIVQRLLNQLIAQDIRDFRVLAAIAKVPRQLFVDEAMAHKAWDNTALPIGHGQTISQPYMVARMTELLIQNDPAHVLERSALARVTRRRCWLIWWSTSIRWSGSSRCSSRPGAGCVSSICTMSPPSTAMAGWAGPTKGPFDAILVTAAASEVPTAPTDQLADGGRLVLPVGTASRPCS